MMRSLRYALVCCVLMGLLTGCGGGGGSKVSPAGGVGRATFVIRWPEPSRLIPLAAQSIRIAIRQGGTVIESQTVNRPPASGPQETSVNFPALPVGALTAEATAYPETGGTGVAQATGAAPLIIQANQPATIRLTMGTTIARIVITPNSPSVARGGTVELTASARDASDAVVITAPGNWAWTSSNPAFPLTASGDRAVVTGGAFGNTVVTVRETESGRSAAATATAITVTLLARDALLAVPRGITTDGANLFATAAGYPGGGRIVRLPITGGSGEDLTALYGGLASPFGITVNGPDLFWIDPDAGNAAQTQVLRAPRDGAGTPTVLLDSAGSGGIVDGSGIATDGARLYTSDQWQGRVHRLNFDGSGLIQIGPDRYAGGLSTERPNAIAESGSLLVIADGGRTGVTAPQVLSIPKSGGTFTPLHVGAPFVSPTGIAVGNGTIFVADSGAGTVWQFPITGGTPTEIAPPGTFQAPQGLVFFGNALYVIDDDTLPSQASAGAIYRVDL